MDLVIFDLDGTLIDSKLDLAHAVNATRRFMGQTPLEHDLVYSYVGNGAPVLIRRTLGPEATEEDVARALEYFLAYYRDHKLDYTVLYPGVAETLDALDAEGVRMAVLTNKPVRISNAILEGLGVAPRFFRVFGGNSFDQKKPHPVGVETLIHYPMPVPRQPALASEQPRQCPTADRICAEVFSLPLHPGMSEGTVDQVAAAVRAFHVTA